MAGSQWLERALRSELSQGDIFEGLPFCTPAVPVTHLSKGQAKGAAVAWIPSAPPQSAPRHQPSYALVAYRIGCGIVVSHDCAIDKPNKNTRVLCAPIAPITQLDPRTQDSVRQRGNFGLMHLPEVPGIGEAYADFRSITAFRHDILTQVRQVASLTDFGRGQLGDALVGFFVLRQRPP